MGERETTITYDSDRSSGEIKESIEDTRERMDHTLDQLNQRIEPAVLWEALVDWKKARGGTSHVMRDVVITLAKPFQRHPMPALALGASAVWLAVEAFKGESNDGDSQASEDIEPLGYVPYLSSEGEYHIESADSDGGALNSLREKAGEIKQKASELTETAKEKLKDVNETVHDKGRDLKHSLERVSSSAKDRLHHLQEESDGNLFSAAWRSVSRGADRCQKGLEENPVGMAAGLLGVGILLGAVFPSTRREDELMGDYAESVKREGRKALERSKRVAQTAAESALHEVEDRLPDSDEISSGVADAVKNVGEAVASVKRDTVKAAEQEHLISSNAGKGV